MKIVINACFGGFSLSRAAVKRYAELQGRPCYFFGTSFGKDATRYIPLQDSEKTPVRDLFFHAFDIPNPNELLSSQDQWHNLSIEERTISNALYTQHAVDNRPSVRHDPLLIQIVEELGSEIASGGCAELKIIEIPDGTDYVIEEYDGLETIAEAHQTWR